MHRLILMLSAAGALHSALPAPGHAQAVPGAPATDWQREHTEYTITVLRSYNALIGDWRTALVGAEPGRAAELYVADARLLMSGHPEVLGRDSIALFLARLSEELVEVRTSLAEFVVSDRLAFASGPLIYTHRVGSDGLARAEVGNHVTVLVREGRRWRIKAQVLKYEGETLNGY